MAVDVLDAVTILDPRGTLTADRRGNGEDLGSVNGKTIGLKTDEFWFAWDWVTEEWAAALKADGADVVIWREPMPKAEEAEAVAASFADFLGSVDAVVTGLATCGGCTMVTVRAGMAALDNGLPTVFVATEHFERLARVLTTEKGYDDIRMTLLPYPLEGRSEADIRQIARDAYPSLLVKMGAQR